ncbi:MAG TPA: hypothetical protein VFE78_40115 [Gemmataceae bacterium]|jgi:uncharacterized coiled-coil protein SlyX|nr:hypothetical protein [Gemmataceae bacterium]
MLRFARTTAGLVALLAAALCAGPAPAQKAPAAAKDAPHPLAGLEEMLAAALKYNPDIRIVEMKLRDDEAELNRARLRVMQKIIALHHALQAQQATVERDQSKVRRLTDLVRKGAQQTSVLEEAKQELAQAESKLSELESELPYLLGKRSASLAQETIRNEVQIGTQRFPVATIRPAVAARIRKALETSVTADYKDVPLGDVLKGLQGKVPGVAFQRNLALRDLEQVKVSLRLGEVPLGAALQALSDTVPGLRLVVRDYGILVTWEHQVPVGAVRLYDFWKSGEKP